MMLHLMEMHRLLHRQIADFQVVGKNLRTYQSEGQHVGSHPVFRSQAGGHLPHSLPLLHSNPN